MGRKKAEAAARRTKAETQAARDALAIVAEPWPALGRSLGLGLGIGLGLRLGLGFRFGFGFGLG